MKSGEIRQFQSLKAESPQLAGEALCKNTVKQWTNQDRINPIEVELQVNSRT